MATWEPVQVDLHERNLANYEATSDWMEFDCVCMDTTAPDYENLPYDFPIHKLESQHFTCVRCGRMYRIKLKVEVEMYTPLAIKYPDAKNSPTLGLRDTED